MNQAQHLHATKIIIMILLALFISLLLSFLLRIYLYHIKLTESEEKTNFLERKLIKEKTVLK